MTEFQHDPALTLRPITGADELDLFTRFPYVINHELADDLTEGRRRPEWMWVALRGDRLLARLAWWSRPDGDAPQLLDILDLDDSLPEAERLDIGERLLRTATAATLTPGSTHPEYGRFIPPDWREDPAARRAVEDRMTVAERTGAQLFVERLRLEWKPGTEIAPPGDRLTFRPLKNPDDPAELIDLMTAVLDGTLDAHGRDDLTRMSPREAATAHYEEEFAHYSSPRDWWRIAELPDGEPVGFVIPAHNGYNATIAYIAVLPAHRGRGYIDELLAEGTRVLAEQDVPRVRAATDLGNVPMAAAFRRAGYVNFERAINMTWASAVLS
ncbi:GNAT family N-acetyltransferase [Streptomyces xanthii]|uniref:GNAT family N-acetyltransferase n=1 Tax=Streptomyces xanthii TaxID=2768069 RepID=UPI001CB77456|nr:GNAT family N-acetyltransferase [Streptomyces xanthii]